MEEAHQRDARFMRMAIAEANKSVPVDTAYCVGCVIVNADNERIVSTGFSRELPGNTHAEECALIKAQNQVDFTPLHAHMYTTMEPCSKRLSGKTPCADLIKAAGIRRVVVGVREPDHFVQCSGVSDLERAGIRVDVLPGFEDECLAPNRHLK